MEDNTSHFNHLIMMVAFTSAVVLMAPSSYGQMSENEPVAPVCMDKLEKTVALTFDDGPSSVTTPAILNILKNNGAKATFFVVGENIDRNRTLMAEITKAGHEVGNHSFSHPQLTRVSSERVRSELSRTSKLILDSTGTSPIWFRPPYGSVNKKVEAMAADLGLQTILWTEDPRDWSKKATAASIEKKVMDNLHPGSVVLLHDNHSATVQALPVMMEKMKERGYRFVTVNELKLEEQKVRLAKATCGKAAGAAARAAG